MQRNQQEIHNVGGQTHADEASASARVQENDLHQDLNHRETQQDADPQSHDDHQHNAAQEFQVLLAESIERASAMDGLRLKLRRKATVYRIVAFIAVLLGLLVVMYPMFFQSYSAYKFAMLAEESNRQVAEWPYPEGELALQQAREYNQNLERSGPHNIGELNDPYSSSEHGNDVAEAFGELVGVGNQLGSDGGQQSAVPSERSTSENDEEYMSILNQGSGVIGSVEVPSISVKLPIHHGTSTNVLNSGAGHLYGTSFPVDQPGSHTVITAHRGLPTAMFFTRLGELSMGDEMYITTMGTTYGYIVDRIQVIEPTDISNLGIEAGEERLTLMTCTPYGINTHRLLVSGLRGNIPQPVSPLPDAKRDVLWIFVCVAIALLAVLICALIARKRRRAMHFMRARHALWLPWW